MEKEQGKLKCYNTRDAIVVTTRIKRIIGFADYDTCYSSERTIHLGRYNEPWWSPTTFTHLVMAGEIARELEMERNQQGKCITVSMSGRDNQSPHSACNTCIASFTAETFSPVRTTLILTFLYAGVPLFLSTRVCTSTFASG
jgi:hypothetical protein